ncbi:phosphomannose isomerase type II C-terminal cupin domain [Candidatus Nomurabacteria bacterium]|nr:phosphomannose isomerase type II C-terminal cupin domain [Candidatus Nomurabacteria bacterium]
MIKEKTFQVERPWGNFRQFTHNELSTVKIITVSPNEILSLQSHKKREEFWHVISGSGWVEIGGVKIETKPGDEHEIKIEEKHRLSAGPDGLQVLEIAVGDFDEEDIVHYEDKYGRI